MARVLVRHLVGIRSPEGHLALVSDALVEVWNLAGDDQLDIYAAQLGGSPLTQPLRSSPLGTVEFWVEQSNVVAVLHIASDGTTSVVGYGPVTFPDFEEAVPLNGQGAPGAPGAAAMGVVDAAAGAAAAPSPGATTETTIWTATLPAGRVVENDMLTLDVPFTIKVETATTLATFRVRIGTTEVLLSGTTSLSASSQDRRATLSVQLYVGADGDLTALGGSVSIATAVSGISWQVAATTLVAANAPTPIDLAAGATISASVQFNTTTATFTRLAGRLRLFQAEASIPITLEPNPEQLDEAVAAGVLAANEAASTTEVRYADRDSSVTANGATVDVPGLTATIPANLGRPVLIMWKGTVRHTADGGRADLQLWQSIGGAAYTLVDEGITTCRVLDPGGANTQQPQTRTFWHRYEAIVVPVDIKIMLRTASGSGTATLEASGSRLGALEVFKL